MPLPDRDSAAGGRAGWRGSKAPPGRAWSAPSRGAGWTQRPERTWESARRWHRIKVGSGFVLAASLITGFLVYLMYRPLRTPLLMATATRYAAPLPPNAWAKEDQERLNGLEVQEVATCVHVAWDSKDEGLRQLREQLDRARPGGPSKDAVVLYVSLHGAVDGEGQPCLIPPDAGTDSRRWLPVREMLTTLFLEERPGRIADQVHKLLVLDAGRIDAEWRAGILYNAFPERLADVVAQLQVPNLVVLNSTSAGQVGWASAELGGSVFGHFFSAGLEGWADVDQGNGDGKVSLQELQGYLASHVRQWTLENRADEQTPLLIPSDADMQLVYARPTEPPPQTVSSPAADPRWEDLDQFWLRHEDLAQSGASRFSPLAWEAYQRKLLRLEGLVLAGSAAEDEFRQTRTELVVLADQLAAPAAPRALPAFRLTLAERLGCWTAEEADRIHRLQPWKVPDKPPPPAAGPSAKPQPDEGNPDPSRPADPATAKADPADPATAEAKPAAKTPAAEPAAAEEQPPCSYFPAAAAAWDWCRNQPTRERFDQALEFLDNLQDRPQAEVAGLQFLRILAAKLDWDAASRHVPAALAAQGLADVAGTPADIRVHTLVRELVEDADQLRRAADDRLLVGTPTALAEADAAWAQASGTAAGDSGYRAAILRSQRAAEALALRDRALAEIPYLAQWALSRSRRGQSDTTALRALTRAAQELSDQLEASFRRGLLVPELDAAQSAVESGLKALQQAVADESYRLRAIAGEDQSTLRAIADLLSVPMVSGDDRNRLRAKYLRIAHTRAAATASEWGRIADAIPESGTNAGDQGLDAWLPDQEHLALTILNGRPGEAGPAGSRESSEPAVPGNGKQPSREQQLNLLARQGESVRQELEAVPSDAAAFVAETRHALEQEGPAGQRAADVRAGLSRADRLVRTAAPLLGRVAGDDPSNEPARQLHELDLRLLLDWHAHRALADFWGSPASGSPPYFQTVASEYLAAAETLSLAAGSLTSEERRLAATLSGLEQAAAEGIQPASPDLLIDEAEPYLIHETQISLPDAMPPGVSAFAVTTASDQPVPLRQAGDLEVAVRRMAIPIPAALAARQLSYAFRNDSTLAQNRRLQATVLYRGHRWAGEFYAQPARGIEIVYEPPRYPSPTVTVFGQASQQASVVFILDCSGSMMRRLGGIETEGRLIDLARDTLEALLLRMTGPDDPFRVGILAYGHRCGWNPAPGRHNELVVPDPTRPGQFVPAPPDFAVHPSVDVQQILPLGAFSDRVRREVVSELDSLRAMGETPLYFATIQALDAIRQEPRENRRHVVMITDGFNQQSSGGPPGARKFRKDVEDALAAAAGRVQLDIVGFDLVAKTAEEQASQRDLVALATATGGAFHPAADPSSLLKALEESLGLVQYRVRAVATGSATVPPATDYGPVDLGRSVTLAEPPGLKQDYRVELADPERPAATEVTLEGGEAIQLYLTTDAGNQRRLVHRRFERDLRAEAEAFDPENPQRRFFVGAHLPEPRGGAMRFSVSLQNVDAEAFSPRPAEVWAEIRPRRADRSLADPYPFYDPIYEPARPVPVLSCTAPKWPEDAVSAEIRLWFKMSRTEPDSAELLNRFDDREVVLDSVPDVRFSLEFGRREKPEDPQQVILVERHPPGAELTSVKAEMWPPPEQTIHRYSFETGTVRHTFVYHGAAAGRLRDARVLLTSKQRLTEGAVELAEPLLVTLPRGAVPLGR